MQTQGVVWLSFEIYFSYLCLWTCMPRHAHTHTGQSCHSRVSSGSLPPPHTGILGLQMWCALLHQVHRAGHRGDGPVGKVLAMQTRGPEVKSPALM